MVATKASAADPSVGDLGLKSEDLSAAAKLNGADLHGLSHIAPNQGTGAKAALARDPARGAKAQGENAQTANASSTGAQSANKSGALYKTLVFFAALFSVVAMDQYVKDLILQGFRWDSSCISIVLVFNKGVAFSFFSFLEQNVKYLQISFLLIFIVTAFYNRLFSVYYLPFAIIIGGGISNIIDRFFHIGVVDYVYWHCGFDFAVFNLADALIDLGIAIIFLQYFLQNRHFKT